MYYMGTYGEDGGRFTAELRTGRHATPVGFASVFGKDRVRLRLSGSVSGDAIEAYGESPDAPGVQFSAKLTRLPIL
jgi:hypothetical protein